MGEQVRVRQYQIGEFARKMGVTPDYLKHYESHGLISVLPRERGYRYFGFEQSPRILQCMSLRNYGVMVDEMGEILDGCDAPAASERLEEHVEALRRRIVRDTAMVEEHEFMKAWLARRRRQPEDWEVTETEPLLYLAHSNGSDFLEDERIYSILEQWVDWMPVVKQTQEITPDVGAGGLFPFTWGVMISEAKALRLGIPVNEAVVRIPAGKAFIYHFGGALEPGEVSICPPPDHRVFALMKQHGLRPAGKIYRVVYMYAHMKNRMEQYGIFIVPLTL